MTDARPAVALATLVLAVALFAYRRWLLDLSCTAVFFASHLVFVVFGVVLAPWLIRTPLLQNSFSFLHWEYLSEGDLVRAAAICVVGLLAVMTGHALAHGVTRTAGGGPPVRGALIRPLRPDPSAGLGLKVVFVFGLLALAAAALAFTRRSEIVRGLVSGYLHGDITVQYEARFAVQDLGRVFYLVVFNALPFLATLAWIQTARRTGSGSRFLAWGMVLVSAVFLVITFEKRPFVLFALTFLLAHTTSRQVEGATTEWRFPWRTVFVGGSLAFLLLLVFYYLSTTVAADLGLGPEAVQVLAGMVLMRIFGRLAAMPLFYAHYFPAIHPYYGIDNIGLLAALGGRPVYQDTIEVFSYFTGQSVGTGAIGALVDFYAGFGWPGLITGSLLIGVGLYALDRWLMGLPRTALNRAFALMMLVFVSSLSQASLPRALSTYGGGVFIMLWLFLRTPSLPRHSEQVAA